MEFIKTTVIGGAIFLVPIVILVGILGKAYGFMLKVAKPLSGVIPEGTLGGVAAINVVAVLLIAFVCFIAGVIARGSLAKKVYAALDEKLMAIPGYTFVKGVTDSMKTSEESAKTFVPVLVRFDDNTQIGFEVERLDDGNVVIYLPGAPNPWSGSVVYFEADRVTSLGITAVEALGSIRKLGRGSNLKPA